MATTGPKTFHFRRSHQARLLLKLLGALGVLLLLISATVFAVKMQKKVKRLFHDLETLQSSQLSQARSTQYLSQEIEGVKSGMRIKDQHEEAIFVQLAELKAAQSSSRRDIDRLTLVNKGYEVSIQELSDKYARLKETNEELTRKVRVMEQMGSQAIHEMKAELIRKVDSANLREEVVKIIEDVLQEKLQTEFNRMFQERKEVSHQMEELEGKVGFVKALDAQSALTHPYPEVEKISNEKQEITNDKSQDPFDISDASDGDVSTSSEEEILKKRREAIDLRVAELIELFNRNGENDVPQENSKSNKERVEEDKAKLLDPFYIEENDIPAKPKVEAKKQEVPKVPEVPNPNDPFYIEGTDDVFVAESGRQGGSNWRQEYAEKAKDLLEKTKHGFEAAEKYVKEQIPTASKKIKEIGKEVEEKARKLNTEIKHQAEKLAEKAKKVSKTLLSLFNR